MRMPGRKFFIPLLILALYFGGRAWYFSPASEAGELAADFSATRLDGATFKLSDLRGKNVLLDFWGSWCGPCRAELPDLQELSRNHANDLIIISVAIESDSAAWRRALARDARRWEYQVMDRTTSLKFLDGEIADLYGINSVPSNVLIDKEGKVIAVNVPLETISRTGRLQSTDRPD